MASIATCWEVSSPGNEKLGLDRVHDCVTVEFRGPTNFVVLAEGLPRIYVRVAPGSPNTQQAGMT
jgi:hypothetical protein